MENEQQIVRRGLRFPWKGLIAVPLEAIDDLLGHWLNPYYGPHRVEGGEVVAARDATQRFAHGFLQTPDLFARFYWEVQNDEKLLAFVDRWGLPNGRNREAASGIRSAADDMFSLVGGLWTMQRLWNKRSYEWYDAQRLQHEASRIRRAATPTLSFLFEEVLGPPMLDHGWDEEGRFDLALGWRSRQLDFGVYHAMQLQLLRALFRDEPIKQCPECKTTFIFKTPLKGARPTGRRRVEKTVYCRQQCAVNRARRQQRRRAR